MSLADSRPDWLAPLSDPRNEAILSAAFDIFQDKGLHGATMLEIATAAKVSKETLYARFDSKEGLLYALLAWGSNKSALDPGALDLAAYDSPVEALEAYAVACLKTMMLPEAIAVHRIVVGEAVRMPEVARVFDEFTCKAGTPTVTELARALDAAGIARIDDVEAFGDAFIGLLRGNLHHHVVIGVRDYPDDAEIEAHARRAMHLLLRAFAF
jgi:AcrR family transcriptional regulator